MAVTLTATPVAIAWGTAANPSPQNITIPSDTTAVYVFAGGYGGGELENLPSFTLGGNAPDQQVGADGLAGTFTSGRGAVWYNPPTGTQELTIAWDQAQSFGPCCIVACVKGGDTSTWRDADAANASGPDPCSVTLTTEAGDFVLKFDQNVAEDPPALSSGWTNGVTQANQSNDSARLSYRVATGSTQVCNAEEESYSVVVAIAIPEAEEEEVEVTLASANAAQTSALDVEAKPEATVASQAAAQTSAIAAEAQPAAAVASASAAQTSAIDAEATPSAAVASAAAAQTSAIEASAALSASVASSSAVQTSAVAVEAKPSGEVASAAPAQTSAIGVTARPSGGVESVAAAQESAIVGGTGNFGSVASVAAAQVSELDGEAAAGVGIASATSPMVSAVAAVVRVVAAIAGVQAPQQSAIRVREPGAGGGLTKVVQHGGRFGVAHAIIRWGRERLGGDHHAAP